MSKSTCVLYTEGMNKDDERNFQGNNKNGKLSKFDQKRQSLSISTNMVI